MEERQSEDVEGLEDEGGLPMPAPWAAAAAILLLVAFGFLIGSFVAPKEEGGPVLLAAAPSEGAPAAGAASAPPIPSGEAEEELEEEPEEEEEEEEAPEAEGERGAEEAGGEEEAKGKGAKGEEAAGGSGESGGEGGKQQPTAESGLPPIKHVFLVVLGEQGYEAAFGAGSQAPYIAKTLTKQGELIGDYYAATSGELANEIALVSGQGPTPETAADCPLYEDLLPGRGGPEGQALGSGCVYPASVKTIGDQLSAAGKTWKAYVQGLEASEAAGTATATAATATGTSATAATATATATGTTASTSTTATGTATSTATTASAAEGDAGSCAHPELGASDANGAATESDPYVTWRDPFLYFHSTIDSPSCSKHIVDLGSLATDLTSASSTPSLSYISPDVCDDGSSAPCAPGKPAGLPAAESFLREVVGEIEQSPAYKEGGLIAITFDEAPQSGEGADSTGCCITAKFPNVAESAEAGAAAGGAPSGGGRVGLLLISKYVKAGSIDPGDELDHFSLLASIEELFKLHPLGYAGALGLLHFNASVYNAPR